MTNQIRALAPMAHDPRVLPSASEWGLMIQMAEALHASNFLPTTLNTPQKALAVMIKGRELGIPPMQAFANIPIVNGKPSLMAELMLALIYRDHGDDALHFKETTAARCVVSYKRRGWTARQEFSFTLEEAKKANLIKAGPWTTYPAAMLRARCISAVARMAFPDSIGGMRTPEELGAAVEVEDGGQVIVSEIPVPEADQELEALIKALETYRETDAKGVRSIEAKYGSIGVLTDEQAHAALDWLHNRNQERHLLEQEGQPPVNAADAAEVAADVGSRPEELTAYVNDVDAHLQSMKGTRGPMTAEHSARWAALYTRGQALVGPATGEDSRPVTDLKPTEIATACSRYVQSCLAELAGSEALA